MTETAKTTNPRWRGVARKCTACNVRFFISPGMMGRPKTVCSNECRDDNRVSPFRYCIICNTEYNKNMPRTCPPFYCSHECQTKKLICRNCAEPTNSHHKWCSISCFLVEHSPPYKCKRCGIMFTPPNPPKGRHYCSEACYNGPEVEKGLLITNKRTVEYDEALKDFRYTNPVTALPTFPGGRPYTKVAMEVLIPYNRLSYQLQMTIDWWNGSFHMDNAGLTLQQSKLLPFVAVALGTATTPLISAPQYRLVPLNQVWPYVYSHIGTFTDQARAIEMFDNFYAFQNPRKRAAKVNTERLKELVMQAAEYSMGHTSTSAAKKQSIKRFNERWLIPKSELELRSVLQMQCFRHLNNQILSADVADWAKFDLIPEDLDLVKNAVTRLTYGIEDWIAANWKERIDSQYKPTRLEEAMERCARGDYNAGPKPKAKTN